MGSEVYIGMQAVQGNAITVSHQSESAVELLVLMVSPENPEGVTRQTGPH